MHIAQYCNSSLLIVFFYSCSSSDAVVNLNTSDYLMNRSEAQSCSSSASTLAVDEDEYLPAFSELV